MLKSLSMSEKYPFEVPVEKPLPNPETKAIHNAQVRKQVTAPLVLSILALAVLVFVLIRNNIGNVQVWAQISTIFLIILTMGFGIIIIMLMGTFVYGMFQLLRNLPPYTRSIQDAVEKIEKQVEAGALVSIKPILKIQEFSSQINNFFQSFSRKKD